MKYKQAVFGALAALAITGVAQRWGASGKIWVDPREIKVGHVEIVGVDSATRAVIPVSVSLGKISNERLFKFAIKGIDGGGVNILYAAEYDPLLTISSEGYASTQRLLSSMEERYSISLSKIQK